MNGIAANEQRGRRRRRRGEDREKGDGLLQAALNGIETLSNAYDGVNIREDDAGNLVASVSPANSQDNDGDGVSFDERGGTLTATIVNSTALGNVDDFDIRAAGNGTLGLTTVTFATSGHCAADDHALRRPDSGTTDGPGSAAVVVCTVPSGKSSVWYIPGARSSGDRAPAS